MSWARAPGRVAVVFSFALAGSVLAQVRPPDAGRVLEDSRTGGTQPPTRGAPRLDLKEPVRPAMTAPESFRVHVKGFHITGTTVFAEDALIAKLANYIGREASFADLEEAAAVVTRYYRDRGYFVARAYLPVQEIRDGILEITVLEGRLGTFRIFVPGARATTTSTRVTRSILSSQQPPGSIIERAKLERGLLLLSDTPGIEARATLSPGSEVGTSDLSVNVADTAEFTGSVDADNFGNRFTGVARLGATGYWNSPSQTGDRGTVRAQGSSGSGSVHLGYQFPVGYDGLRLGAALTHAIYRLCCDFEALEAEGQATDVTAMARYPLVRGRSLNVYGTLSAAGKSFINRTFAGTTSDKTTGAAVLGVSVDGRDGAGGGGLNGATLAVTIGKLSLSRSESDLAIDAITAEANGSYTKTIYSVSRLQRLGATTSLYAAVNGQRASKNLDSSEQFALGGPTGVRAYPTGEAIGDEGTLLTLEARWQFSEKWQAAIFADRGQIRLHRDEWPGWQGANTTITNAYFLSGAGLGLSYTRPGDFVVRIFAATKVGINPGRNATGNDADNQDARTRGWIQVIKYL